MITLGTNANFSWTKNLNSLHGSACSPPFSLFPLWSSTGRSQRNDQCMVSQSTTGLGPVPRLDIQLVPAVHGKYSQRCKSCKILNHDSWFSAEAARFVDRLNVYTISSIGASVPEWVAKCTRNGVLGWICYMQIGALLFNFRLRIAFFSIVDETDVITTEATNGKTQIA